MMDGLSAGFADPVRDAQRCFRAVLDAMSRPGLIRPAGGLAPPAPLDPATAAVLLTLVDHETPLWVAPALGAARPWLDFHAGAPAAGACRDAAFVVATALPPLDALATGDDEAPETSATLILQLPALGRGPAFRLSGPGLREPRRLRAEGLGDGFAAWAAANRRLFPCGVDLILCAGEQLTALPRTTVIERD